MEGAALAGAGQRDRPRKGGKRTKASKAQELFEEEVKRLPWTRVNKNQAWSWMPCNLDQGAPGYPVPWRPLKLTLVLR